jgi:hypothetical protein
VSSDVLRETHHVTELFEIIVGVLTPRSPDVTPRDFFLWGYVKDQVCVPPFPTSTPELKERIRTTVETITADMLQTNWITMLMFV